MTTTHEIVVVEWHDAHSDAAVDWVETSALDGEPYAVTTIGVNLGAIKLNHISVALCVGHGVVGHVVHIPCGMVNEITVLGTIDVEI